MEVWSSFLERFLKIGRLNFEQYRKNQCNKKEHGSINNFTSFCHVVVKKLMVTKNLIVKIQNPVVNHESRPVNLKSAGVCGVMTYESKT